MPKQDGQLEAWLQAVNHPLRRSIIAILWECREGQPMSPVHLADELEENLSKVGYHMRCLHSWEATELVRIKPVRGAIQHFYKLEASFRSQSWVSALIAGECSDDAG